MKLVMGDGSFDMGAMIVGEAPGRREHNLGRPFVGPAGEILNDVLGTLMIDRREVYITNAVKFWPQVDGKTRPPTPEEIVSGRKLLYGEIDRLKEDGERPRILTLGKVAKKAVLDDDDPMGAVRGRWHYTPGGLPVMPTWHPSYILHGRVEALEDLENDVWTWWKGDGL